MTRLTIKKNCRLSSVAFVFAVAAGVVTSSPALAGGRPVQVVADPDVLTRSVTYADLNLASLPGESMINRRVRNAVLSLCEEATGTDAFSMSSAYERCRTYAWKQARPQISSAIHRARDLASTGTSTIAAASITIALPQ